MIAKDMSAAQRTPLIAAFPKMLMPFVVILPGLIVMALMAGGNGPALPLKPDGQLNYDMALPTLLFYYFPSGLLGVGLTALLASFMSGMAGNVTAFNTVWTFDIYQAYIRKGASDRHYFWVGKITTVAGIALSIATAYLAMSFNNIMDFLQLVFGFVNAPLFATFLLGMAWKRATGHGAFWGLVAGTASAAITHGITLAEGKGGWLVSTPVHQFTATMGQNFTLAIVAWTTCFVVTILVSLATRPKPAEQLVGLVYGLTPVPSPGDVPWYKKPVWLGAVVLIATILLNVVFF
jgi:SSS family solute:Na+ symporter